MRDSTAGTLTLLFTDIEGSTRLWEQETKAMRVALARHNAILQTAMAAHGGHVFKTVGDQYCVAFPTASKALAAALESQLTIEAEPWPISTPLLVRMALHTGAAEMHDGDYFGPPLNRVARLLAIAHGGQVILSDVTQELVRDELPDPVTLRPLGKHRLKDLTRAETVFQLLHPDLRRDFPALRSLEGFPNNLPVQVTSFVGREQELVDVKSLLATTHLLTLTGSGGCGKTRLALHAAVDLLDGAADGVWLVELASLADGDLVAQRVATALGLREETSKSLGQTVAEYLRPKQLLLVLDNCEHLITACAEICDNLIRTCPNLKLLCTSRQALGVAGETTYRVPPLSLPDPTVDVTAAYLNQYDSVRLFINRAVVVETGFVVNNHNAPALAAVCCRLGGIPLAIELAAARVRAMSVEDINAHLDQRFRLLTGGSRTAVPRQQTLRSLIDWSYDLLGDKEKLLLARLSVFAGGWTLDASMSVCADADLESWDVLDLLTSLVDKSLVVAEPTTRGLRYHVLETIRQYGRDRLLELGLAEEASLGERHCDWFLRVAEQVEPNLRGADQVMWLGELEIEHDNLRAALAWCRLDRERSEAGLRLAGALRWLWDIRGYLSEGRAHLLAALSQDRQCKRTSARAKALNAMGALATQQGDYVAAWPFFDESLQIGRELGHKQRIAVALGNLGLVATNLLDYVSARPLLEESLSIRRELGDQWGIANVLGCLGNMTELTGDHAGARSIQEEALALCRSLGDNWGVANALNNLGRVAHAQGDDIYARSAQIESLTLWIQLGSKQGAAWSLEALGTMCSSYGQPGSAATLWGAADALREAISTIVEPFIKQEYDRSVSSVLETLGTEAFGAAWERGRRMSLEQAAEFAAQVVST